MELSRYTARPRYLEKRLRDRPRTGRFLFQVIRDLKSAGAGALGSSRRRSRGLRPSGGAIGRSLASHGGDVLFERDISVQASILCNLAPLVWDHHLVDESEILWHAATTIPWTAELATARYVVHRSLAWHAALKGHNIDALARFRECADFAPTISWRLASTLDRAYLAAQMREKIILREEMLRAGTFAACISWDDVAGDEAELLLDLAEANARTDVTIARGWLDAYDRAAAPKGMCFRGTSNGGTRDAGMR